MKSIIIKQSRLGKIRAVKWSLWLIALLVVSCQNTSLTPTSTSASQLAPSSPTPLTTPLNDNDPQGFSKTPVVTAKPAAFETPLPSLTAAPIYLSAETYIPAELAAVMQAMTSNWPDSYAWKEDKGEVILSIDDEHQVANWIYAIAAPFYTLEDGISSQELQSAWQDGLLYLDEETNQVLQAFWGIPTQPATIVPVENLVETLWLEQEAEVPSPLTILPFNNLSPKLKALRLDGMTPVDVKFQPDEYGLTIPVGLVGQVGTVEELMEQWPGPQSNRDDSLITTVAMTGPAGMRRAVADRMEKYGLTYPAEETGPVLQAADIAHMSNENAFASDCSLPDPFDSDNVCNRDEYLELMIWMGIDVNEMTGNHLNDWGPAAMQHTFDLYEEVDIKTFGGGRNLEDAKEPLLMEHNGNKLAFLGCNPVGPEMAWARADYPGSRPCDDYELLKGQIRQLDEEGYLVIVTLQYNEDYLYDARPEQRELFRDLAEAGAMAVSGSHGHHPQGFAFQGDSFIHYGLGNLLADQMWSMATRQSFIDTYLIYDGRLLNVDLWTGLNEDYARIRIMSADERRELLQAVFAESDR